MERISLPKKDMACGISFLHQNSVSETYHIHNHDFYELFYVVKGSAMHSVNNENECLVAGTLELIRPDDCHEYSFINKYDMELISIGIDTCVMREILAFLELDERFFDGRNQPFCRIYEAGRVKAVADELLKLGQIKNENKRRSYGKAVISRLVYELSNTEDTAVRIPEWLSSLIIKMSEPDNFKTGLPVMLKLSGVSQNHLNREMKKYIGMTPTELINSNRIAYAGMLLQKKDCNISEAAESCGFETMSNFYENFRRVYGCSPREYIKR